ncbi:VCBS repeat-containing protein [Streptomyces olivoreticuli]
MTDKGLKRLDLKTLKTTDVGGLGMPVGPMTTSPEGKIYFTNGSLFRYDDSTVNPQPGTPVKASDLSELVLADVDGDGKGDILGKTGESSGLYWFKNKGNNTFAPGVKVFDSWKYTQTTAADFDGDGKTDLVAVDGLGNLKLWKGNGDGTFGKETQLTKWAGKQQTTSGDVDKDGIADLVALDTKDGKLKMWKGTGDKDKPFAKPLALTKWAGFTQTTASDVDGDGIADLIAADKDNVLKFWKSNGNTEGNPFAKPVTLTKWAGFTHTTAGDLDGDHKHDLLAIDTKNKQLKYWKSNGDTSGNPFSKPTVVNLETATP